MAFLCPRHPLFPENGMMGRKVRFWRAHFFGGYRWVCIMTRRGAHYGETVKDEISLFKKIRGDLIQFDAIWKLGHRVLLFYSWDLREFTTV